MHDLYDNNMHHWVFYRYFNNTMHTVNQINDIHVHCMIMCNIGSDAPLNSQVLRVYIYIQTCMGCWAININIYQFNWQTVTLNTFPYLCCVIIEMLPMKTPVWVPLMCDFVMPASSMAIWTHSRAYLCCGSILAASVSLIPNSLLSHSSWLQQQQRYQHK